jgi:hypothetical protein
VAIVVRIKKTAIKISLIICLTVMVMKSSAQRAVNLQKTILVPANAIQLDSLLHLINKQAGVKFSINTRKFPAGKYIRVKAHRQTIAGLLKEINQSTGVYYAVLGDHIILLDNPPAKTKAIAPVNTSHTAQASRLPVKSSASQKRTVSPDKNTRVKHRPVTNTPPVSGAQNNTAPLLAEPTKLTADPGLQKSSDSDTLKTIALPAKKDSFRMQPPARKRSVAANNQSTARPATQTEKRTLINELLVKGGLSADDVFYCSPTIQAGVKYVYGIAAWSSNFNISGFRYGLGGVVPLSDQWKLHVQVTTGNLLSSFDTTSQRWEFKTTLHRAGCIAEADLAPRLSIQFGPVFNLMKLVFYRGGVKTAPGLTQDHIDKKFDLIKPVYTLSDNSSINRVQSTKTWIGFQVGIYYDLNFFKRE